MENKNEEELKGTSLQFTLDGDNYKVMKMAGYTPAGGNYKNGYVRVVSDKGARFHAYVYPSLIYIHYDEVKGYKHKTKPHPQLLKGEINRIKGFEQITNRYLKGGKNVKR